MTKIRRLFQRYLPTRHEIHTHRHLKFLGERLHDPHLWHLDRHSVAAGLAVGLFIAFVPAPVQMLLAALIAIAMRVNLPFAVVGVWLTNPLTMAPVFLFAYRVGTWILDIPARLSHFEMSFTWLGSTIGQVWQPLLLGCFVLGSISAALGYIIVRLAWRQFILHTKRGGNTPSAHP